MREAPRQTWRHPVRRRGRGQPPTQCTIADLGRTIRARRARHESNDGAWYYRGVIIDAHTHVFPESFRARRETLAAKDPLFAEMYGVPTAAMATPAELLAAMDEAGV